MNRARLLAVVVAVTVAHLACAPAVRGKRRGRGPRVQVGIASYYNIKGGRTASGERLNPRAMTAAHRTYPFGTIVEVRSLENPRRRVVVRINDRGPFVKGRIIDLTPAAFRRLAPLARGVVKVRIRVLRWGKGRRPSRKKGRRRRRR